MDVQIIKAIEMTRQIRDRYYQRLMEKSHAERISFYRQQAQKMEAKISDLLHDNAIVSKPITK